MKNRGEYSDRYGARTGLWTPRFPVAVPAGVNTLPKLIIFGNDRLGDRRNTWGLLYESAESGVDNPYKIPVTLVRVERPHETPHSKPGLKLLHVIRDIS